MATSSRIEKLIPSHISSRVRSVRLRDGVATVVVDASGLGRSAAATLQQELEQAVGADPEVKEVRVALMAERTARQVLAIGSGKGGVGKSTLTANLAVALAREGRKVGIVDADISGPSQVMLLDGADTKPRAEGQQLIPVESKFGVKLLSMGHLVEAGKAIAWRGPMVGNALGQMMEAQWDDTELLLIDLPPGTGDVQLTMLQRFKPAGAIIVSTPQDLALIDALRAIDLFNQTDVPIVGIVENMAGYACPNCGDISDPFGAGGAEAAAARIGAPFLGRVPLTKEIRIASDAGQPSAAGDSPAGEAFREIAAGVTGWLDNSAG